MATPLERAQEIANRGLQDRLDPEKRARFDELVNRKMITLPGVKGEQTFDVGTQQGQQQLQRPWESVKHPALLYFSTDFRRFPQCANMARDLPAL